MAANEPLPNSGSKDSTEAPTGKIKGSTRKIQASDSIDTMTLYNQEGEGDESGKLDLNFAETEDQNEQQEEPLSPDAPTPTFHRELATSVSKYDDAVKAYFINHVFREEQRSQLKNEQQVALNKEQKVVKEQQVVLSKEPGVVLKKEKPATKKIELDWKYFTYFEVIYYLLRNRNHPDFAGTKKQERPIKLLSKVAKARNTLSERYHATAYYLLGCCVYRGIGLKKPHPEKAIEYLLQSANADYLPALELVLKMNCLGKITLDDATKNKFDEMVSRKKPKSNIMESYQKMTAPFTKVKLDSKNQIDIPKDLDIVPTFPELKEHSEDNKSKAQVEQTKFNTPLVPHADAKLKLKQPAQPAPSESNLKSKGSQNGMKEAGKT